MSATVMDQELLRKIDEVKIGDKLCRFRELEIDYQPKLSVDRLKLVMESMKETEGEDIALRRAKALKKVCENIPIAIHDWQMLVGSDTRHLIAGIPHIDLYADLIPAECLEEEAIELGSPLVTAQISDEDRRTLKECISYFLGKTIGERIYRDFLSAVGGWYDDFVESKGTIYNDKIGLFYLTPLTHERVVDEGLRGIIHKAEESIQEYTETQGGDVGDFERVRFWEASIIACEAVISLAKRYSKLAAEMAKKEQNAERRKELEEIAKVCAWVPENPARTFHEACQSTQFVLQGVRHETPEIAISPGRCDQYLLPYFLREIRDGSLTMERAVELIGNKIAFANNWVYVWELSLKQASQISRAISNWSLGGFLPNGDDGFNEMTYLTLHTVGELGIPEPHFMFRPTPETPDLAWVKAIETNCKAKAGFPQFQNEMHHVEFWTELGYSLEEAHDLVSEGCVSPLPRSGAAPKIQGEGPVNMPLALDLALHNGVAPMSGKRIGVETGDPRTFKTFEDVLQAHKKQYEFMVTRLYWLVTIAFEEEMRNHRQPFLSTVVKGCLEKGKDICLLPQLTLVMDRGMVDTGDSLYAIEKLVFDEKRLTMGELMEALDSNFEGERGEEIRQMCLAVPKYGNDIDGVDFMVRDIAKFSSEVVRSLKSPHEGSRFYSNRIGATWHYFGGLGVGASANGRKAGTPLYDGSLSPGGGFDKSGPTAVLRSAIKADYKEALAALFNQKFTGTLMRSPENRAKLVDLTKTFMNSGGLYIQYNLVDAETLRDAQIHPEKHHDLVVRVAGFSVYFVHLVKEIQDEIIYRTEQTI